MINADKPIYPQSENWQNDMEKHSAAPDKYGHPSFEGIGLTKREYFAAMAMQGLMAVSDKGNFSSIEESMGTAAKLSIKAADELLKQLEK